MDKKEFLAKLKKYDVGTDFQKKSLKMIERLFDKTVDAKSQKAGMDFVLKIYKNQSEFKKSSDKIKVGLKNIEASAKTVKKKAAEKPVKKKGLFRRK